MTRALEWIALDWGTSHLRAWAMSGNEKLDQKDSDAGMGGLAPGAFEQALISLVEPWLSADSVSVVAAGMVGARQGWHEAPYVAIPASPLDPTQTVHPATSDPRLAVTIIHGLSQNSPPDVMRGEETQIAGLLRLDPDFDGVICLPGTHTKWARISAGEVCHFATSMTGELFQLLADASVLRHSVGTDWDEDAFQNALDESYARPQRLAGLLFGIRATDLLSNQSGGGARARLSGLLIGAELAAMKPYWLGQRVAVIGAPGNADRYRTALETLGTGAETMDAEAATLAGLSSAFATLKDHVS